MAVAGDSIVMAQAQYWMGGMLYDDGMYRDALDLYKDANNKFGNHYIDCAKVLNSMACCYMLIGEYDNAAKCLDQGLAYAFQVNSPTMRHKVLNNYAVLYRIQGQFDQAIAYHTLIVHEDNLTDKERTLLYLNLGKVFAEIWESDSAAFYYNQLEAFLPNANVKAETKVSAYNILSHFAKSQCIDSLAFIYQERFGVFLYEVMQQRQEHNIYRIQQQYDYENLQNAMNQKIIWRHRVILVISVVAIMGLIAFALSRVKLAQTRKEEAETKANLFHFMQQNKELAQKNEIQKQYQINLSQKCHESELAYRDLLEKLNAQALLADKYGEALSQSLKKEQAVMLRLHLFMENKGDEELLTMLEKTVFGKQEHWEAIMEAVDQLYPNLRKIVSQEELGLDELEQKDVILSYIGVSRHDESLLLQKSTDMVDKIRNRSRKKIKSVSEGIKLPKIS